MSIGSGCLAQAGNMKEYIKNKDLGLKSPGSSYALFRAYVRKHGKPAGFIPRQRLTSKTLVNQSLPEKWRRLTPESKAFWAEKVSQIGNKNAEHRSMLTALAQATEEKTPTDQPPSKASSHGSAEGMVFESDGQLWLAKTELGRGTYGQVFAVRNPETGHSLAAKVAHQFPSSFQDLETERSALNQIHSPFVVTCFGYALGPNNRLALLEDMGECSLLQWLEDTKNEKKTEQVQLKERWQMILQLGRGLAHVHSLKLIHCDLKPNNCLVFPGLVAKLADFGMCKSQRACACRANEVFSLPYRPPELLVLDSGDAIVGEYSDVYAYGLCIQDMLGEPILIPGCKKLQRLMVSEPTSAFQLWRDTRDHFLSLRPLLGGHVSLAIVKSAVTLKEQRLSLKDLLKFCTEHATGSEASSNVKSLGRLVAAA